MLPYSMEAPAQTLGIVDAPPVTDGRVRFRQIFCALVEDAAQPGAGHCPTLLHRLDDEAPAPERPPPLPGHNPDITLLFVPGLFSDCTQQIVQPFSGAIERLRKLGYHAELVRVEGRSSPARNASIIAEAVRRQREQGRGAIALIGHSKGAVDSLVFLDTYPNLAASVVAVASVAGAINGSPLGDALSDVYQGWLAVLDSGLCPAGDGGAISSLRRAERMAWLLEHRLPDTVRYYSVAAFTSRELMHFPLRIPYQLLSEIDPRNDGQLLYYDQVIPGATLLGYANTDHWGVAADIEAQTSPGTRLLMGEFPYPGETLTESLVLFLVEDLAETGVLR